MSPDPLDLALRGLVLLCEMEMPEEQERGAELYDLWRDYIVATLPLAVADYYARYAREVCA